MTSSRRRPLGVRVVIAVTFGVVAFFGMPGQNAWAFSIPNHEMITRNALPPDQVDQLALAEILVGPPPGGGAMGSDAFPTEQFRHIDNSQNPTDICARGQQAWNTFSPVMLDGAQYTGNGLANPLTARAAFGALLHALQDFYAHSNWVEDNIVAGQLYRLAPPIFPTCNPADFPADLHTGYFNLQFGTEGCPPGGPPPGFQQCHSTLNKDSNTEPEGSKPVPGTNMTMFDLAAQLATTASTNMYQQLRGLIAGTDGDDSATCFFQASLPQCGGPGVVPALPDVQLPPGVALPAGLPALPAGVTVPAAVPTTGLGPPPN